MNLDEGDLLQKALEGGLPCDLKLATYNDAVSLRARLTRYLKNVRDAYMGTTRTNELEGIEVLLIKPRTLRFEKRGSSTVQFEHPDLIQRGKSNP